MGDSRRRSGIDARGSGAAGKAAHSDPAPASKTEVSSPRVLVPDALPTAWIDRLLVGVVDLPVTQGERVVVDTILDAVVAVLPSFAVGANVLAEGSASSEQRLVLRRAPGGGSDVPHGASSGNGNGAGHGNGSASALAEPGRIFAGASHEYVAPIPGFPGSTLHLASDEIEIEPDSSPAAHLLDRAAVALGRGIARARSAAAGAAHADRLATFGQVAAGVVHELNNPLTSIVAYSDYLIRRAPAGGDSGDLERLRRISEAANRMLRFTRDLVSYARPTNGPATPVVVHDVIDRAVAFCEHVLAASSVRVDRQFAPDVRTVVGVTEQLVQVFVNLLTNACQAAPEQGGTVTIGTQLAAGSPRPVVVVVHDSGTGIAAEHLPHVFVPFFTTKGDRQGTGLGLSIVRSIVEGHGGTIQVDSPAGSGARFVLELPLQR
jgi:two-component system NtrC family sensor kinase